MLRTLFLALALQVGCAAKGPVKGVDTIQGIPDRIAFGSCARSIKPQPILNTIVDAEPDLFVYLGDNIYGDTRLAFLMRAKYEQLAIKKPFKRLRANVPVLSIWDDHDFGGNDDGAENPFKTTSEQIFLDFWRVPADSDRRKRPGIYGHHIFEENGRKLQLILLDTRYFRGKLTKNKRKDIKGPNAKFRRRYKPNAKPTQTVLGEAQWTWLSERLRENADVTIIASSTQFAHAYNGLESWNNFPAEKARMLKLIQESGANGVIFTTGDVHWGEISLESEGAGYPIYDVTSSGLTQIHDWASSNKKRVGKALKELNFGVIDIDWEQADPEICMRLLDSAGEIRRETCTRLSEISAY